MPLFCPATSTAPASPSGSMSITLAPKSISGPCSSGQLGLPSIMHATFHASFPKVCLDHLRLPSLRLKAWIASLDVFAGEE